MNIITCPRCQELAYLDKLLFTKFRIVCLECGFDYEINKKTLDELRQIESKNNNIK